MKIRNSLAFFGTLLLSATFCHAASYTSDFSGLASNAPLVPTASGTGPGVDGWTQSEANSADDFPIAYGQPITGNPQGVAVGGNFGVPDANFFYVQHTVGLPFAGSSLSSTFTTGRPALDPGDPNPQNRFEIGAYGTGGINLFSMVMEPSIDSEIWLIDYRTEGGANTQLSVTDAFQLGQITDMTVSFTASGTDIRFDLQLTAASKTLNFDGMLPGLSGASFESVRIVMDHVDGTNPSTNNGYDSYGTNFIAVTNIQAVPEPSSLLLLGLAGCAALRRKRA